VSATENADRTVATYFIHSIIKFTKWALHSTSIVLVSAVELLVFVKYNDSGNFHYNLANYT